HTRSYGDWSSAVCSSDLGRTFVATASQSASVYRFDVATGAFIEQHVAVNSSGRFESQSVCIMWQYNTQQEICGNGKDDDGDGIKIGRASCRERGGVEVVA